jgi:UDP:flavonoid glycosyltransferase YjiC (YdhE family)
VSRFLLATSPLLGHAGPLASIGGELAARGHEVAWLAHDRLREHLLPVGAEVFSPDAQPLEGLRRRGATLRGAASIRFYFGDFVPTLAANMREVAERAVAGFRPDLVVAEHACLAGSIAARRADVPWIGLEPFISELREPLGVLPRLRSWIDAQLAAPQVDAGLQGLPWPVRSPHRTLICGSPRWLGEDVQLPPNARLIGMPLAHRPRELPDELRSALGPGPRVLITLGTLVGPAGIPLLQRAVDGLAARVGTLIVASPEPPPRLPEGTVWRRWIPQLALLPELDAVLCHGGHNSVCESLWHDLPVLAAALRDDGPLIAARLVACGAGLGLAHRTTTAAEIGEQMSRLLHEPSFKQAAAALGADLRAQGGAATAADVLERAL